jgi:hypothetical protein
MLISLQHQYPITKKDWFEICAIIKTGQQIFLIDKFSIFCLNIFILRGRVKIPIGSDPGASREQPATPAMAGLNPCNSDADGITRNLH